ncbi:hypothetical protein [Dethiothermospora halolimnae]
MKKLLKLSFISLVCGTLLFSSFLGSSALAGEENVPPGDGHGPIYIP